MHSSLEKTPFDTCYVFLPPSPLDMGMALISDEGKEGGDRKKAQWFLMKISSIHAAIEAN